MAIRSARGEKDTIDKPSTEVRQNWTRQLKDWNQAMMRNGKVNDQRVKNVERDALLIWIESKLRLTSWPFRKQAKATEEAKGNQGENDSAEFLECLHSTSPVLPISIRAQYLSYPIRRSILDPSPFLVLPGIIRIIPPPPPLSSPLLLNLGIGLY